MSIPTPKQVQKYRTKHGPYRLACQGCDRDDFDGVKRLPKGWDYIRRVQSLKESLTTYDRDEYPKGYSVLDWYTHMGICPDCREVEE